MTSFHQLLGNKYDIIINGIIEKKTLNEITLETELTPQNLTYLFKKFLANSNDLIKDKDERKKIVNLVENILNL